MGLPGGLQTEGSPFSHGCHTGVAGRVCGSEGGLKILNAPRQAQPAAEASSSSSSSKQGQGPTPQTEPSSAPSALPEVSPAPAVTAVGMPPKSILKNSTVPTNAPPASKPVNKRHLNVALHHASLIEQRKQIEQQVLHSIITLLEFPTVQNADPTRPSASDALRFRDFMIPFQPSDYDSLIEERNIAEKCGYALCPHPKRQAPSRAKKQFVDTDKGVEIVDRKLLEVWCSDDCARRALYVKVQLNETPAWMRQGGHEDKIELMVENPEDHHKALPLRLKKETAAGSSKSRKDDDIVAAWAARDDALADLAVERGEKPGRLSKANKDLITAQIRERVGQSPPVPPSLSEQTGAQSQMAIEGHVPRINREQWQDDEDEDNATDWDKHIPG
ncbi:hypothetical protein CC78DRAFT_587861 [Lojkania enalia]|uniref:RNA polymerase II subunit B1 CTD phosphatase RPAP2 homolog n=1 Tax=Lojkania enalia TaxID=147567 RepID=A0A9P4K0E6_9PLEO|nr:hypothetical protein CC78DRAFT_587861 [Didymosphaeria enalia]